MRDDGGGGGRIESKKTVGIAVGVEHGAQLLGLVAQQSALGAQAQILLLELNDAHRDGLLLVAAHVARPLGALVVLASLLPVSGVLLLDRNGSALLCRRRR